MFSVKEKAKWEAWNKLKGTPQDQAKSNYVALVKANVPADVAANLWLALIIKYRIIFHDTWFIDFYPLL